MPNHVHNELGVAGLVKDIANFKKFAKKGEDLLSADKFIPYPRKWKQMDKDHPHPGSKNYKKKLAMYEKKYKTWRSGFDSGGYAWRNDKWGTKWGLYDTSMIGSSNSKKLDYQFMTAWSPALPVIKEMSSRFPTLKFNLWYAEQGNCFQGWYECEDGKVTRDDEDEYHGDLGG